MYKKIFSFGLSHTKTKIKKYILSQFPYPSGDLHLGHARVYYIGDAIASYYKMKNYDVIYPIGWDSFGLPAQNAAILHGKNPKQWTQNNIKRMKHQLQHLGVNFDWQMQLSTSNPQYYRWTQQIFVKMFKKGLAYKKMAQVNWDPIDKTVLANQQVDQNGYSWRSGAKVQKKLLSQWFLKITSYGQILQNSLQQLQWIQKVKNMQKAWINFRTQYKSTMKIQKINKQTNITNKSEMQVYFEHIQDWKDASFIIKKGNSPNSQIVGFLQNPLTSRKVYVVESQKQDSQNFILINIDKEGNKQFYKEIYKEIKKIHDLKDNIKNVDVQKQNQFQKKIQKISHMRLKDWLISRQRYWGCPIPIIYCPSCGPVAVPQQDLPVVLPQWKTTTNPLLQQAFIQCKCPMCNSPSQRQCDTMDTFVDSSWYYTRFMDSKNLNQIFTKRIINQILPVDIYIGGIEHAIMHLLYARFVMRFLKDQYGLNQNCKEPFKELVVQGLVKGRTLSLKDNGRYISHQELDQGKYKIEDVRITYEKMSKSKFNGLNPNILVDKFGIDALRIAIFFANPPDRDVDFSQQIVVNADRFLKKIMNLWKKLQTLKVQQHQRNSQLLKSEQLLQLKQIFQKLQTSIQHRQMHTYVANMMQMLNFIKQRIQRQCYINNFQKLKLFSTFIRILQIIAPQLSSKLKQEIIINFPLLKNQQFNIWPSDQLFGQKVQILIMKGKKMIAKQTVNINMTDQQIVQQLKQVGVIIQIKRQKKKFIAILKQ